MRFEYLTYIDPMSNKFRYYQIHVTPGIFCDWALVREWGRLGSAGKVRSDWFESETDAIQAGKNIFHNKIRRGYRVKDENDAQLSKSMESM